MNIIKSIRNLSRWERGLWLGSLVLILLSFLGVGEVRLLTVLASMVGATALIFVAKGDAIGQLLTMVFAALYAVISFQFCYYGEMITYLGMTLPSAGVAMVNWLKHPYAEREVKVSRLSRRSLVWLAISSVPVTAVFGILLEQFGTANLFFSTVSITTSYLASMLTILRSPYYAVAYACNDIILIILWILATREDGSYLPMVFCFVIFLINDSYGFWQWQQMKKKQKER